MGLFGFGKRPQPPSARMKKASRPPAPTGLFGERRSISRSDLKRASRSAPYNIPGGGTYTRRKREELMGGLFGSRSYVTEQDFKRRLKKSREERYHAKTGAERLEKDREVRFLEGLMGK